MSISANDLRKGDAILVNNTLYVCVSADFRVRGRKSGFVQVVLRNVKDGSQLTNKFASGDKLDKVDLFEKAVQFLYSDGETYHFMDNDTYNQFEVQKGFIGDQAALLKDGMNISMTFYEESPIATRFPLTMEFEIIEAEPEIKGATAQAQYKGATIDNGLDIKVPSFVKVGDKVKINTETLEYLERVK